MHPILTHLAAVVVGAILWGLFSKKAVSIEHAEVAKITSKIEALKATDVRAYNTLMSEWTSFLDNKKAKLDKVSSELKIIIAQVKNP